MGTGIAKGENRAVQAAQQAISSPLLEDISISGARAALINISAGPDLGMHEFEEASSIIFKEVHDEAQIILGTAIDPSLGRRTAGDGDRHRHRQRAELERSAWTGGPAAWVLESPPSCGRWRRPGPPKCAPATR